MKLSQATRWLSLCVTAHLVSAQVLTLDTTSASSVKSITSEIVYNMMSYYTGNVTGGTPGLLPGPYYWWEAGGMFGAMVDYWYYTGDTTYVDEIATAMQFQAGTDENYMPANQTKDEGNDDQVFWAFSVMDAAELNFPLPESDNPSWLALGQAVFNTMAARWDPDTCGGGLRWQIFQFNAGYDYKNAVSNLGFFQLAARLGRYTGNETYIDWADQMWDWFSDSVMWDAQGFQIYDGASTTENCSSADHMQWSYNYATGLAGLAYMYNHTSNDTWLTLTEGVLKTTLTTFFPTSMGNKIMVEVACEPYGTCDTDQLSFKAYLSRWLAVTAQLVPSLADTIMPYIEASATGAAGQCHTGTGVNGAVCGMEWNSTTWDNTYGVGQQMSALAVIGAQMLSINPSLATPYTADTGGTSKSDPSAGTGTSSSGSLGQSAVYTRTITTADKAGAGITTAIVLCFLIGGPIWMLSSGS